MIGSLIGSVSVAVCIGHRIGQRPVIGRSEVHDRASARVPALNVLRPV